jgi:hypothetical protein
MANKAAANEITDRIDATAGLSAAETAVLDGVVAGTVAASKAAVVDANKDIGDFRNLDCTNLDAGASGVAGTVEVFPTTTAKGKFKLACADQDADTLVTLQPSAMAQASVISIPDPGAATANVLLTDQANDGAVVTATSAELNLVDGSVVANSAASKAALLDASKLLQTNANNGTPETGVTAVHYGDGVNVTAVLTLTNVPLTVGSSENLGVGALIYTLPAGACLIRDAYMSVGLSGVSATTDTPEVGLGTVIASGVVTALNGTATFEDIITGQVAADTNGTATVKGAGPTAAAPLEITTAGAHTVHVNAADGWGANADADGLLNGTVVISYIRQAA